MSSKNACNLFVICAGGYLLKPSAAVPQTEAKERKPAFDQLFMLSVKKTALAFIFSNPKLPICFGPLEAALMWYGHKRTNINFCFLYEGKPLLNACGFL